MSNPTLVTCPADTCKPVATNVTAGIVHKKITGNYLQTYKMTGEAAPTGIDIGVKAFGVVDFEEISASTAIDVYIMSLGKDGQVRVDIP